MQAERATEGWAVLSEEGVQEDERYPARRNQDSIESIPQWTDYTPVGIGSR